MRPITAITYDEWLAFWKRNRPLRKAWLEAREILMARDPRRASRLSFIMGWLCAERHYRERMAKQRADMLAAVDRATQRAIEDYEVRSGVYELD